MQKQQDNNHILVTWRGKKFTVPMTSSATLKEFGDSLQKLTDVRADTLRLIVRSDKSSKMLYPFSDEHSSLTLQETPLFQVKSIMMMGVPKDEVDQVLQNAKADMRIAGFDEEERRLRQRTLSGPSTTLKLPQGNYIFSEFRTLHIPGLELTPPASEALKLMHMLAADPGIVAIMNKHRWRVGIMTEMAPEGYVGVSSVCILGFNKNQGEEISLRLRTDDLKGFRKYQSIKKTLLHELAHMVYSEHDANFYALDKQLNQEAVSLDWTRSTSHTLSGARFSREHEEELSYSGETENLSRKLGGKGTDQLANARLSSVAAAYRRLDSAVSNLSGTVEAAEKHNDSELDTQYGADFIHAAVKELSMGEVNDNNCECNTGSNAHDCIGKGKMEPDPDDSGDTEVMESETYRVYKDEKNISEPDPDDSEMMSSLTTERVFTETLLHGEPDPENLRAPLINGFVNKPDHFIDRRESQIQHEKRLDEFVGQGDSAANQNMLCDDLHVLEEGSALLESMKSHQLTENSTKPDPDIVQKVVQYAEPDPDDSMVPYQGISETQTDEPDPNDQELQRIQDPVTVICNRLQKAIEMLQSEVNPSESVTVLQTLFKIIRNVIEHPNEIKFRKLRKANPVIQRNVANYKAAMEILLLIGFIEDVVMDEIGKSETYLILKRNDPGLLWLAKSSLETCISS
ncbi:WLM domain-containing protein [Heracleum sosnowskyi]|uniref:WLM domain-containing protein n=1 Tax=Heracleum sosnowskyi TaxID=360622 RepID=A0AAD8J2M3_9APIA|nr:WLM domain-containing protein [Heracleum sosnowskyi]